MSMTVPSGGSSPGSLLTRAQVLARIPSPREIQRLLAAGWLVAARNGGRSALYHSTDVDQVIERIVGGELPPLLDCEIKAGRRRTHFERK